jgi:hypothetical protein
MQLVVLNKGLGRFYQVVLGRSADSAGLDYWTETLNNGTKAVADVAKGFILSKEFINQKCDMLHMQIYCILHFLTDNRIKVDILIGLTA